MPKSVTGHISANGISRPRDIADADLNKENSTYTFPLEDKTKGDIVLNGETLFQKAELLKSDEVGVIILLLTEHYD